MTIDTWKKAVSGFFDIGTNWSSGSPPTSAQDAGITTAGTYTVTVRQDTTVNGIETAKGATLAVNSGDTFQATNGTDGGVSAGTISLAAGAGTELLAGGTFDNTGTVNLLSGDTLVALSPSLSLTGTGTINMSAASILSDGSATTFTNYNGIAGTGEIGDANLTLTNYGRIYGSELAPSSLTLNTGTNTIINESTGVLGAENGGILNIDSNVDQVTAAAQIRANLGTVYLNDITVTGGQVDARVNGGEVVLNNATLVGASLDSAGSTGVITTQGLYSIMDGGINTANLVVADNTALTLEGSIDNYPYWPNSQIDVASTGDSTQLLVSGSVSLTGGGSVNLSDNSNNLIDAADSSGDTLTTNNIISGAGSIGTNDGLTVNNTGVIVNPLDELGTTTAEANGLVINLGGTLTNTSGSLQSLGAGGMDIQNTDVVNGSAVVGDGSVLTLDAGSSASGVAFSFYDPSNSYTGDLVTALGGPSGTNPFGSGSTVAGFAGTSPGSSDMIDMTQLKYLASNSSDVWTQGSGEGTLAVTEGRKTFDVALMGTYSQADFSLGADKSGGTVITTSNSTNVVHTLA